MTEADYIKAKLKELGELERVAEHNATVEALQEKIKEAENGRNNYLEALQETLDEALKREAALREALLKVFNIASPSASKNEWLCFKAAKEALAQEKE